MNDWFTVLKDAKQISSTGVKTKLGTKPLTITDDEDRFPCCEEAREKALQIIDFREKNFIKEANCEDLFWKIHYLALSEFDKSGRYDYEMPFTKIRDDWKNCVQSQANENPEHDEQRGWHIDYRDVGYR